MPGQPPRPATSLRSPAARRPCPRASQAAGRLPCGSCPPGRTGRWGPCTCPAGGSIPRRAGVADRATLPVPRPPVRASRPPAFPVPSFWRPSPAPSTPCGGPRRRASWQPSLSVQPTPPCGRVRGRWPGRRLRRRGSWGGPGGTRPRPSGHAAAPGLRRRHRLRGTGSSPVIARRSSPPCRAARPDTGAG